MGDRRMSLLLTDSTSRDEDFSAEGAGAHGLADARLLFDVAELLENFGLHDDAGAIDSLGERFPDDELGAELCRLGVRVINALDELGVVGQRECFEALSVAERLFRRAVEVEGDHHRAYRDLALVLLTLGRDRDAVVVCREWMAELMTSEVGAQERCRAFFVLGVGQVFSGVPVDAVFTFSSAMERVSGDTLMRFGLALAYLVARDAGRFDSEREAVSWEDLELSGVLERLRSRDRFNYGDLVREMRALGNERYASLLKFI